MINVDTEGVNIKILIMSEMKKFAPIFEIIIDKLNENIKGV